MSRLRLSLCAVLLAGTLVSPALTARADDIPVNSNAVVYNTNGAGLRLRAGPNTQQNAITTVPEGATVTVVEGPQTDPTTNQDWYRITYNGQTGWVAGSYLGLPGSVPVAGAPTGRGLAAPVSSAPAGLGAPAAAQSLPAAPTAPTPPPPPPPAAPLPAPSLTTALTSASAAPLPAPTSTLATTTSISNATTPPGGPKPVSAAPRITGGRPSGAAITQVALSLLGTPYVWAGKTPAGFDCAGFVLYVYQQFGISLPPTTYDQWNLGRPMAQSDLLIGDLVFFANTYEAGISHVGIYIGDNTFVHAENESTGVVRSSLVSGYWATKYYGARRIIE